MTAEAYPLQEIGEDEELLSFSSSPQEQAYIGHLRGDFGRGTEFWTTWWDHHEELKGQEFKDELDHLVKSLRESGPLKDLRSMERFCQEHVQARMSPKAGTEYYGFRVDTAQHYYYLRLCPIRGNYNFYIYCYKTGLLERPITVLVVEPMKPCYAREFCGLKAMQELVGGDIEMISPFTEPTAIVCNAIGKGLGLPYNRPLCNKNGIPYDIICGTFFITGVGSEKFISLTEDQIRQYKKLYDNIMVVAEKETPPRQEKPNQKKKGEHHER